MRPPQAPETPVPQQRTAVCRARVFLEPGTFNKGDVIELIEHHLTPAGTPLDRLRARISMWRHTGYIWLGQAEGMSTPTVVPWHRVLRIEVENQAGVVQ